MTSITYLKSIFEFQNEKEIINYLENNEDLIPLLEEAKIALHSFFGDLVSLSLEYNLELEQYEEDQQMEYLIIFIKSSIYFDLFMQQLRKFSDQWILKNSDKIKGRFAFGHTH